MAGASGIPVSLVHPGLVVFGRVSGFPWWPAAVTKCMQNQQWCMDGKFWVVFFNENTGAWLKPGELRIFDAYNCERCLEFNTTQNKFRRYKDKITKAMVLADSYMNKQRGEHVKVLAPKGRGNAAEDGTDVVSVSDEGDEIPESIEIVVDTAVQSGKKRIHSGKSDVQRFSRLARVRRERAGDADEISEDVNETDGRPRRKRTRSSKYEDFIGALDGKNNDTGRRGSSTEKDAKQSADGNAIKGSTVAVIPFDRTKGNVVIGAKQRRRRAQNANSVGVMEVVPEDRSKTRTRRSAKSNFDHTENGHGQNDNVSKRILVPKVAPRYVPPKGVLSKRLAQEPMRRMQIDHDNRPDPAATREMYISDLKNINNLSHSKDLRKRVEKSRKDYMAKGTNAARSLELASSQSGEGTDSEDHPARVRRVVNGSLEYAAEDLMELAVRRGQGERSVSASQREDILDIDMNSLALGGSQLVPSILNRLSDLEKGVALLQEQSTRGEQATLGEDASAAGLKSAVEAFVNASNAFAKARDFNASAIYQSLDLLWPSDGHFPLSGHDGALLRTMARSLVIGSCKRQKRESQKPNCNTEQGKAIKARSDKPPLEGRRLSVRDIASSKAMPGPGGKSKPVVELAQDEHAHLPVAGGNTAMRRGKTSLGNEKTFLGTGRALPVKGKKSSGKGKAKAGRGVKRSDIWDDATVINVPTQGQKGAKNRKREIKCEFEDGEEVEEEVEEAKVYGELDVEEEEEEDDDDDGVVEEEEFDEIVDGEGIRHR